MKKSFVIAISILAIAAAVFTFGLGSGPILGIRVIKPSGAEKIISQREKRDFDLEIMFKDFPLPVDEEGGFYITQGLTGDWNGVVTPISGIGNDINYCFIDPECDKASLISSGKKLELLVYDDKSYSVEDIVVTGLPIVSIDISHKKIINKKTEMYGRILVFDNRGDGRDNVIKVKQYEISMHQRGHMIMDLPKPSYKIELHDENGYNLPVSLLNMREDDDWILNPLYMDNSRMREKLAYDIWDRIGGEFSHDMEYCEVLLDSGRGGQYLGLYCLQEPVDLTTFGKDSSDSFLISSKTFNIGRPDVGCLLVEKGLPSLLVGDVAYIDNTGNAVELDRYLPEQFVYIEESVKYCLDLYSDRDIKISFEPDNANMYCLFLDILCAIDNIANNEKICGTIMGDGSVLLKKTPWDLDLCMRNTNYPYVDYDTTVVDSFPLDYVWEWSRVESLYQEVRVSQLTEEWIDDRIETYADLLVSSGAFERERARWTKPVFRDTGERFYDDGGDLTLPDMEYSRRELKEYFDKRLKAMDSRYRYSVDEES